MSQEQTAVIIVSIILSPVGLYWGARLCALAYFQEKMKYHRQLLTLHEPIKE